MVRAVLFMLLGGCSVRNLYVSCNRAYIYVTACVCCEPVNGG